MEMDLPVSGLRISSAAKKPDRPEWMADSMKKIKLLVMDVDGTLTDGHIYMSASGEAMKAFSCKDGYGITHILPQTGVVPVILTARQSLIVANRAKELGITEVHQGVHDKLPMIKQLAEMYGATAEEVAYIGDDLNDLECICWCGLTGCPQDSVPGIKERVNYICPSDGGRGAVREFIVYIDRLNREV